MVASKSRILFIIIGSNHKTRGGESRYEETQSLSCLLPHHSKELLHRRKEAFDLLQSGKPFRDSMAVKDYPFNAYLMNGKEFGGTASARYMEAVRRFDGRFYQEISQKDAGRLSRFRTSVHHFLILTPLYGLVLPQEPIQAHNFHLPDHDDISRLWKRGGFLTSLVLAYIDKFDIKKVFDFTASHVYRQLLNWTRISKKFEVLHAFGSENAGPDLLPALGKLLESKFLSESEDVLLGLASGKSFNADYEDVVFFSDLVPPAGYPREKLGDSEIYKEAESPESYPDVRRQGDNAGIAELPVHRIILITTGEHHSPFGKRVESLEDLPESIRLIFDKIGQIKNVSAIHFGEYTSRHSRVRLEISIWGCERNSGHIFGHLAGNFQRASKVNVDFKVAEGKELETLQAIRDCLEGLCEFEILIGR